jgi:hypothetical protein
MAHALRSAVDNSEGETDTQSSVEIDSMNFTLVWDDSSRQPQSAEVIRTIDIGEVPFVGDVLPGRFVKIYHVRLSGEMLQRTNSSVDKLLCIVEILSPPPRTEGLGPTTNQRHD